MMTQKFYKLNNPLFKMEGVKNSKSRSVRRFVFSIFSLLFLTALLLPPVSAYSLQDFFDDLGMGSLLGYDNVYKANWGHICCVQEDTYDIFVDYGIGTEKTIECDDYTDECSFYVTDGDGSYKINSGSSINVYEGDVVIVPYGSEITFKSSYFVLSLFQTADLQVTKKAKSFYIKGQENGKTYRQESCLLNSDLKSRVLADGLNELQKTGSNSCQNYLIDFVSVASKTYSYMGQEVICQTRQLYGIEEETFKDGSTKKFQGSLIKSVECCPSESNCNEGTFTFVENNVRECSYNTECSNGGDPVAVSGTSYVKYECISGSCVKSDQIYVDCTNNAVCIQKHGENSVCDLSMDNYGKCVTNSEWIGYCGDGVCESIISETKTTCPEDCGNNNSGGFSLAWYWWILIAVVILLGLSKLFGIW
jgi:hypothetical protein